MRILLVQPHYANTFAVPPLGLGYIASTLERDGHEVELIDLTNRPLSDVEIKKNVQRINPELIGISLMSKAIPEVRKMVKNLKEMTVSPIVLGGPQPTVLPIFTLMQTGADFAVVGEGENTVLELVHHLERSKEDLNEIDGLAFVDENGEVKINNPRKLITDLNQIPFPAWHFMPPSQYEYKPVLTHIKGHPIGHIVTTRGCPYQCNFCGAPKMWGRTFRMRSPKNVVDEIEMLVQEYGVGEIFLSDDNFTLVRKHAMGICEELIRRKLEVPWACPNGVRIDRLDRELLKTMRKAGCHLLGFGIESGSQQILNRANKQLDLTLVERVVNDAHQEGIATYGFFIIGLLEDTTSTIRQTINFAKSLPLDLAAFGILVPYPGTEVFEKFIGNRPLTEVDWGGIDESAGMIADAIEYAGLTSEDLVYWQRRAYAEFYFRPKILMNVLKNTSLGGLKTMIHQSFIKRLVPCGLRRDRR